MKKKYISPMCKDYPLVSSLRLMAGSDTSLPYDSSGTPITDPDDIH